MISYYPSFETMFAPGNVFENFAPIAQAKPKIRKIYIFSGRYPTYIQVKYDVKD